MDSKKLMAFYIRFVVAYNTLSDIFILVAHFNTGILLAACRNESKVFRR
jgi:hypothetical protein